MSGLTAVASSSPLDSGVTNTPLGEGGFRQAETRDPIQRSRGKYDGVYHYVLKNLRARNRRFFTFSELSAIVYELNEYLRYRQEIEQIRSHNKQLRALRLMETTLDSYVQQATLSFLPERALIPLRITAGMVPISPDEIRQRESLMKVNIASLLARKALKIVRNHSGFARSFRYVPSDSARIVTYFCERMSAEVDIRSLCSPILAMHNEAKQAYEARKEEKEEEQYYREEERRDEEERCWRARRGFQYDDAEHEVELSQNGYRRAWYSGRRYGAGSDSD